MLTFSHISSDFPKFPQISCPPKESFSNNKLWNSFFTEGGKPVDRMKEARRINKQGQIFFVVAFLLFQIVF